jgi:hypothetical protein
VFTRAEAAAAGLIAFAAAAIVLAYLAGTAGIALHPIPILMMSIAAAVVVARLALPAAGSGRADVYVFAAIVGLSGAWLLWLAWPHLLPIGGGSDLTHHLLLIDYIDRTGHLPHDRALWPYLGEMLDYTPGAHLLAVLAGRWSRTDGLHAIYAVVALSVALKLGIVFLIARRSVDRTAPALVAPLALFLPHDFLLGSFAHDSFLAQVVAELFAVAAWWAIVCWDQTGSALAAALFGIAGVGTFLTWPVWIGPVLVTFLVVAWLRRGRPHVLRDLAIAIAPIAVIVAVHAARRLGAATTMAGASGYALIPTPATTGWIFPIVGVAGTVLASRQERTRTAPILIAAIAIQAAALVLVARASGAEAPYLALKMAYLAIYPLAVATAIAAAAVVRSAEASRSSEVHGARGADKHRGARGSSRAVACLPAALLLIPAARFVVAFPRPTPAVSNELLDAGRWAHANVPAACVDYLVADDDSAYWLHLAVLGNPRNTPRSLASETFEPQKALVRWILPGGLRYAITTDVDTLPRDIRANVDVLGRFGRAAVLERRGASTCP